MDWDGHYALVLKALFDGRLALFLGAGVNRCGRPPGVSWQPEQHQYLPDGAELSRHLQTSFGGPAGATPDLARVSEYVFLMAGDSPLYLELHKIFDGDYPPTEPHRFIASLPSRLRRKGCRQPHQLIVTTNYDDLMERALRQAGEEFDVVSYRSEGEEKACFVHTPADGVPRRMDDPANYLELPLKHRTILVKIHGAVDRGNTGEDSFVITEDHYIDYLTHADLSGLVPAELVRRLKESHILFLGYALRDWNLRVILRRLWREQKRRSQSWAILLDPDALDDKFWEAQRVDLIDARLEGYLAGLSSRLDAYSPAGSTAEAARG